MYRIEFMWLFPTINMLLTPNDHSLMMAMSQVLIINVQCGEYYGFIDIIHQTFMYQVV